MELPEALGPVQATVPRSWARFYAFAVFLMVLFGGALWWNVASEDRNARASAFVLTVSAIGSFIQALRLPRRVEVRTRGLAVVSVSGARNFEFKDISAGRIFISPEKGHPRVVQLRRRDGRTVELSDVHYGDLHAVIEAVRVEARGAVRDERLR